jgi:hypothetical protein
MFTLLVSWLLVACVPGLLMLVAHGLGRLEGELARGPVTTTDVDEFLEHAEGVDVHTLAREGMPEAMEYLHRRQARRQLDSPPDGAHREPRHAAPIFAADFGGLYEPELPEPRHDHSGGNPEFKSTRYVNRV